MTLRVSTKTTIQLTGAQTTVGELTEALKGHNPSEKVWMRYSPGDPRDPREHDTIRLEIGA